MRRLMLLMMACAVGLSLVPADAAVVRGTNLNSATSPVSLLASLRCEPSTSDMILTDDPPANDNRMPYEFPAVPATPIPEITPELGSRYLQYVGASGIGRGPSAHFAAGDNPTAASIRVAAPTGQSYVLPFVVGFGAGLSGGDPAQIYLGIGATPKPVGPTWSTVTMDFNTAGIMHWFAWNGSWSTSSSWSIGPNVIKPRPGWEYQVGFLVGCGTSTPIDVDGLTVSSTRSGTQTYDFDGQQSAVSATASAATVKAGRAVTIAASATQNGVPAAVPLRAVRCRGVTCQYLDDTAVTSAPGGPVDFTVHPEVGWTYGVRYDGDAIFDPSQANVAVGISPYVSAGLSQRTVHIGDSVGVGGHLAPCTASTRHLVVQRLVQGAWRTVGRAKAAKCRRGQKSATVRGSIRAGALGVWKVRLMVPAQAGYAAATSRTLRLTVTKRPVRHVTAAPVVAQPHVPVPHTTTHTSTAPPPPV